MLNADFDCNCIDCLTNEDGICTEIVPTIIKDLIFNSKECMYYSNDFEKDFEEFKKQGGVVGILKRKD